MCDLKIEVNDVLEKFKELPKESQRKVLEIIEKEED